MLLFFAISGIWQTLGITSHSSTLSMLSTIHTGGRLKSQFTLSSPLLRYFIVLMATGFIVSIVLGVILAVKYGRKRSATYGCLVFGVLFPSALMLISSFRQAATQTHTMDQDNIIMGLAVAAESGDSNALNQLSMMCSSTAARPAVVSDRGDRFRPFRLAFNNLGLRAGSGDDSAVEALLRASQMDELQGFAVGGLGIAAGLGNQQALEPLLHPVESHILPSSAIPALEAAADNGNQKAIAGLAAVASNPKQQGDWYMAASGLQKAAAIAGNDTAIRALGVLARNGNDDVRKRAISILKTAASNHNDSATQILRQVTDSSN